MKLDDLKKHIESLIGVVEFEYNGTPCGIDPLSRSHYDMWYGEEYLMAKSIDEVMSAKIFDNKSLVQIFNRIRTIDY